MVERRHLVAVEEHPADERELAHGLRRSLRRRDRPVDEAGRSEDQCGATPHLDTSFRPDPSSKSQPPVAAAG